ncbi:hypothetical protein [Streptomyces scabiei]|uniref:hypothetical protein n=1 Tax=Streptomyces scabiei TaxID=1930 RepID=UPI001B33AF40|nr:hypothetical protein [Streptomyces sp. LBUM 1481]
MAITDFFDRGWRARPEGTAFVMDERTFTYREIGELSHRVANALSAAGLQPESKGPC